MQDLKVPRQSSWGRRLVTGMISLIAICSLTLLSSKDPKHLMTRLHLTSYQPMEGYFQSDVDTEICFRLERTDMSFNTVAGSTLGSDLFNSFKGQLFNATYGNASADLASGPTRLYTVVASQDSFNLHNLNDANASAVWTYTRINTVCATTTSYRKIEITPDMLTRVKVTADMEDPFLKRWNIKRYVVSGFYVSAGKMRIRKTNTNVYRATFLSGDIAAFFQPSIAHFLKEDELTLQAKVKSTGKIVSFVLEVVNNKTMIIKNADGTALAMDGDDDSEGTDEKEEL